MSNKSFMGIPVTGDIDERHRTAQRPLEELTPLVQAVLDDPHVISFGWAQYTPYFNDGDPCEFGTGEFWIFTDGDAHSRDYDEDDEGKEEFSLSYGNSCLRPTDWDTSLHRSVPRDREDWQVVLYDKAHALSSAIGGDEFLDVLLGAFGDHAEVTVRRDGITVDSYEHD